MRRRVTLSTGAVVPCSLTSRHGMQYYPDVPHCYACDVRLPLALLRQCEAPVWHSPRQTCGRYLCLKCVQQEAGADLCPVHATREGD